MYSNFFRSARDENRSAHAVEPQTPSLLRWLRASVRSRRGRSALPCPDIECLLDYQHISRHYERTALILLTQGEEFKQGTDTPDISMVCLKSWAVTTAGAVFHQASSLPLPPPCLVRCGSANGQVGLADFDRPNQPVGLWLPIGLGACFAVVLVERKAASEYKLVRTPSGQGAIWPKIRPGLRPWTPPNKTPHLI